MQVFSRWGELLYEEKGLRPSGREHGWDGSLRGQPMAPGVYVYLVEAVYKNGETEIFKGEVVLVR